MTRGCLEEVNAMVFPLVLARATNHNIVMTSQDVSHDYLILFSINFFRLVFSSILFQSEKGRRIFHEFSALTFYWCSSTMTDPCFIPFSISVSPAFIINMIHRFDFLSKVTHQVMPLTRK